MSDGLIDFLRARLDDYAHEGSMWHEGCDLADPDGCRCEVFLFVRADVQAKRAILDDADISNELYWDTLKRLASVYSSHADFDQRWSLPERTTE